MKDKKNNRWCSKHQRVHRLCTLYHSCRFPNDKRLTEKAKTIRKYIHTYTPYSFNEEF